MKFRTLTLLVAAGTGALGSAAGKPDGAIEGVNRLAVSTGEVQGAAFSPAAAFFALLMLGELDGGGRGEVIEGITRLSEWRGKAGEEGDTTGWVALENTYLIDHIDSPAEEGERILNRWRGKAVPVNFWDNKSLQEAGLDRWTPLGVARSYKTVLLTEARYRPLWEYAMRDSGVGEFNCVGGEVVEMEYIQSRVVPAMVWGGGRMVEFSLALKGGGVASFSMGKGRWEGKGESLEAIVFIPKIMAEEITDAGGLEPLRGVVGSGTGYDKLFGYGGEELSKWLIRSEVDFRAGGAEDWTGSTGKGGGPLVLRLDGPFSYRITGARGEIIIQGQIGCAKGDGDK